MDEWSRESIIALLSLLAAILSLLFSCLKRVICSHQSKFQSLIYFIRFAAPEIVGLMPIAAHINMKDRKTTDVDWRRCVKVVARW